MAADDGEDAIFISPWDAERIEDDVYEVFPDQTNVTTEKDIVGGPRQTDFEEGERRVDEFESFLMAQRAARVAQREHIKQQLLEKSGFATVMEDPHGQLPPKSLAILRELAAVGFPTTPSGPANSWGLERVFNVQERSYRKRTFANGPLKGAPRKEHAVGEPVYTAVSDTSTLRSWGNVRAGNRGTELEQHPHRDHRDAENNRDRRRERDEHHEHWNRRACNGDGRRQYDDRGDDWSDDRDCRRRVKRFFRRGDRIEGRCNDRHR